MEVTMKQEIEIEYKMLLSLDTFNTILKTLPFPNRPTEHVNYYFETDQMTLQENKCALRIRKKGNDYVVTLKEPHPEGILETHDIISEKEAKQALENKPLNAPNCQAQLKEKNIQLDDVNYVGELMTERYEFTKENLIYVLDKSHYNGFTDYELEIEAQDHETGREALDQLIRRFKVKRIPTTNKIERFFLTLNI